MVSFVVCAIDKSIRPTKDLPPNPKRKGNKCRLYTSSSALN